MGDRDLIAEEMDMIDKVVGISSVDYLNKERLAKGL